MKITEYPNAIEVKLKNKCVTVADYEYIEDTLLIQFKILDAVTPNALRVGQTILKDKIVVTEFAVSKESAQALMIALEAQLNRDVKGLGTELKKGN